ncbi:hypothetical protein SAMN05421688_0176 [Poseidonocella pacifica]|uniref:Uncharacterized protein n=1 Tax=Poseidonocella pacifica TaxID=871651 RepID=A0A1I0V0T1_9RHOB|nr:hypothetical protein [Poseidonocella pacifica]SFA69959.1 hypothetical protein SAMN05421688_0176 [Poseidonocella pacifica]
MAQNGSGSNAGLAFILGAVVVVVVILGYLFLGGDVPAADDADIEINLPDGGEG